MANAFPCVVPFAGVRLLEAVLTALVVFFALAANAAELPNVLFIAIDDLRPELGCYGSKMALTPHLDALAAQGLRFDRAYCNFPICGASRASLLSGLYPTATRFHGLDPLDKYDPTAVTLPQAFKQNGFTTLSNGKVFHDAEDANERSWSEAAWRPEVGVMAALDPATMKHTSSKGRGAITESPDVADDAYPDGQIAQKTIEDLRRLKAAGKPFFLACGFIKPHMPFYAPKKYWELYDRDTLPLADNRYRPADAPAQLKGSREFSSYFLGETKVNSDDWHRMMRHGYLACTSYADAMVGRVLDELDHLGLAETTIVVVWGDHGWHLGEHDFWGKHNTLHDALRIPLIIRVPPSVAQALGPAGRSTQALVETVDVYPTLCDLAGLPVPEHLQGRSLRPLFLDPGAAFRASVYCRFNSADTVVTDRYSYTRYPGKAVTRMLYDRQIDPQENRNIASQPAQRRVVEEMDRLLDERIRERCRNSSSRIRRVRR